MHNLTRFKSSCTVDNNAKFDTTMFQYQSMKKAKFIYIKLWEYMNPSGMHLLHVSPINRKQMKKKISKKFVSARQRDLPSSNDLIIFHSC